MRITPRQYADTFTGEQPERAELDTLRRLLWLVVRSAGGVVVVSRDTLQEFDPHRWFLETDPQLHDGSLIIVASNPPPPDPDADLERLYRESSGDTFLAIVRKRLADARSKASDPVSFDVEQTR